MSSVSGLNGQSLDKYEGLFLGKVVDNNDPLQQQRVRVTIPKLFSEELPIESLPWIGPRLVSMFGVGENFGAISIPSIGANVAVSFQEGKAEYGLVMFDVAGANFTLPDELVTNYPDRLGFLSPTGDIFYYDRSDGTWFFRQNTGTSLKINADGSVDVLIIGDHSEYVKGNSTRVVEGDCTEVVKGKYTLSTGDMAETVNGNKGTQVTGDSQDATSGKRTTSSASWSNKGVLKSADDILAQGTSLNNHQHADPQGGLTSAPTT